MITVLIAENGVEARIVIPDAHAEPVKAAAMRAIADSLGFDATIDEPTVEGGGEEQPRTQTQPTPEPRPLPEPQSGRKWQRFACDEPGCDYVPVDESTQPRVSLAQHRRHRHSATPHPTRRSTEPAATKWPAKAEPLPAGGIRKVVVSGEPIGKLPVGDVDAARARAAHSAHPKTRDIKTVAGGYS